jgi:phosphatidylserine/phosphatidylglycerophosphate/cardiolipin synthase-like enzyme
MPRRRLEMELIMSRRMATFAFLAALVLSLRWGSAADQVAPKIEVYFSPKGGCTEAVVRELDAAKDSVLVKAYSFTSAPIAKALVDAHRRGVKVQVILDKSQRTERYSSATFLKNAGIPTYIDDKHAIAHNKVMVIDGGTVITGSFNFTKAAEENNAENLLVIRDPDLPGKYAQNWQEHLGHSSPYGGIGTRGRAGSTVSVPDIGASTQAAG